jgi:exportin-T
MDLISKTNLLLQLHMTPLITSIKIDSKEDEEFAEHAAKLCSSVGLHYLEALQMQDVKPQEAAKAMQELEKVLPVIFKLFSDQDDQVSSNVVGFISSYIQTLKKNPHSQQITMILDVIRRKARYTDDFNFDPMKQDEYESGFLEYRRELFTLFKNIAKISPLITKSYVQNALTNTFKIMNMTHFAELEVDLSLFYNIGEPLSGLHDYTVKQ